MPPDALWPQYASYPVHRPAAVAAGEYWLSNRRPGEWRDKVEVAITHDHDPDSISDEQLAAVVARELRERPLAPQEDAQ